MTKENKQNIEDIYPLSPMQEGMLYHELAQPGGGAYFEQYRCTYKGDLNSEALKKAWQKVIDLNPILRTLIVWERNDKPLQVVRRQVELECHEADLSSCSRIEGLEKLDEFLEYDLQRGFNLIRAPLMRIALFRLAKDEHVFIFSFHHILLDGWSSALLLDTVYQYYQAYQKGGEPIFQPVTPYSKYISWLNQQDNSKAEVYWRNVLKGFEAPTTIIEVHNDLTLESGTSYEKLSINLSLRTAEKLRDLSRQHKVTLNTIAQGAWAYLLSCYSGERDVVFGSTVSGRQANVAGIETMIGLFINTIPVRVKINTGQAALEWLKDLQVQQLESREFEFSSLAEVQKWSEVPRRQALFDSILIFENYPVMKTGDIDLGFFATDVDTREQTNYPLTIGVEPANDFLLNVTFDTDRFNANTINSVLLHFKKIFENIADSIDKPINHHSIISEQESRRLQDWNRTYRNFETDACLHDLTRRQAEVMADKTAVSFNGERITYTQLDEKANKLANYLLSRGIVNGELVGLCISRSIEMIVAILAILKSGAAYLPLDPEYPSERIGFILDDADVRYLITESEVQENLPLHKCELILIDREIDSINSSDPSCPSIEQSSEHIAYVIYTSGSTGTPKGVQVPHSSVVNFLYSMAEKPGLRAEDTLLAVTTLSFDIAVLELFLPLVVGATIELVDRDTAFDGDKLLSRVESANVTTMQATPSTWRLLLMAGWGGHDRGKFKVLCGGEALTADLAEELLERASEVWNMYGPTETTIWSTISRLEKSKPVLIGKPIANTQVYVLNDNMQQQPIAVRGEIYIAGAGVTKGYLNRDKLTRERFVPDNISAEKGAMMYRTGDQGRYLPDGSLQYINRLDNQVKLRGFRIELGEIEVVLTNHPDLRHVVVVVRKEDAADARLVAYFIVRKGGDVTASALRKYLRLKLPEYMIPQHFVELEKIPTTPNGKVDHAALPTPYNLASQGAKKIMPQTESEELVAGIWRKVINVDAIGIHDNFFEIGGHSLLAVKVIAMIKQQTGVKLELRSVVVDTLEQIAALLFEAMAGHTSKRNGSKKSFAGSFSQIIKSVLHSSSKT